MRILLPLVMAAALIVPRVAIACDDDDIEDVDDNEDEDDDTMDTRLDLATEQLHERLAQLTERVDALGQLELEDEDEDEDEADEPEEADEPDDADETVRSFDVGLPDIDVDFDFDFDFDFAL